jgi:hypothetical protein
MVGVSHVSSQFDQDCLHGVVSIPVGKAGKLGWIDLIIYQRPLYTSERIHIHTIPFFWFTQGRLTWFINWIVGGLSGYSSPQCILRE